MNNVNCIDFSPKLSLKRIIADCIIQLQLPLYCTQYWYEFVSACMNVPATWSAFPEALFSVMESDKELFHDSVSDAECLCTRGNVKNNCH